MTAWGSTVGRIPGAGIHVSLLGTSPNTPGERLVHFHGAEFARDIAVEAAVISGLAVYSYDESSVKVGGAFTGRAHGVHGYGVALIQSIISLY